MPAQLRIEKYVRLWQQAANVTVTVAICTEQRQALEAWDWESSEGYRQVDERWHFPLALRVFIPLPICVPPMVTPARNTNLTGNSSRAAAAVAVSSEARKLGSSEARKLGSSEADVPPLHWLSNYFLKGSYIL